MMRNGYVHVLHGKAVLHTPLGGRSINIKRDVTDSIPADTAPGWYRAKFELYGMKTYVWLGKKIDPADEVKRLEKNLVGQKHLAVTKSPGTIGFQPRADASSSSLAARQQVTKNWIALLSKTETFSDPDLRKLRMLAGIESSPSHFERVHDSVSWSVDPRLVARVFQSMTGMQESRFVCAKAENDLEALAGVFREVAIKSLRMSVEDASALATALSQDMLPSRTLPLAPKSEPGSVGGAPNPKAFAGSPNRIRKLEPKDHPGMIGAVPMDDPTGQKKTDPSVDVKDADPFIQKPWARRGRSSRSR